MMSITSPLINRDNPLPMNRENTMYSVRPILPYSCSVSSYHSEPIRFGWSVLNRTRGGKAELVWVNLDHPTCPHKIGSLDPFLI